MGDIADLYDHWDDPDEPDMYAPRCQPVTKTCRLCGTSGLHWREINGKWRLFNQNGKLHDCSVKSIKR